MAKLGIALLLAVVVGLNACIAMAPVLQAAQSVGATPGDRRALLPQAVSDFNSALYWGDPSRAMALVLPEGAQGVALQMKKKRDGERMVENRVEGIEFDQDAWTAKVDVIYKFFKVPFYIVVDQRQVQEWRFSIGNGWKLASIKETKG